MKTIKLITLLFISTLIFTACGPDSVDTDTDPEPAAADYHNGFFVVNEGGFGAGDASITFVSDDYETIESNVYSSANAVALGDVAQSMFMYGDKAYIVVNASNKIEVVNRYTMERIGTINGAEVNNPRQMVFVGGTTAYLSNWGEATDATDDFISIIDLETDTVTGAIGVGEGPEDMLATDGKVYVNLQGGWGQNNKVVVIDVATNTILANIEVHDVPNSLVEDSSGNVWVLCGGKPAWTGDETAAAILKIEGEFATLTHELAATNHPNHMTIDGDVLYYTLNGQVYSRETTAASFLEVIDGLDGSYYGMYAKDGKLFTLDSGDGSSEGTLRVYDISTATLTNTATTGIFPTGVAFN